MVLWVVPVTYLDAMFKGRPETLSVQEVADLLGMTKPGVYRWLKDGVIPGYKVGSTWFILRDELKATLQAGANAGRGGRAEREREETQGEETSEPG